MSAGEFGVVYRGKLKAWGTKGEECLVAAKTLKGIRVCGLLVTTICFDSATN